jgi:hypothetical protein
MSSSPVAPISTVVRDLDWIRTHAIIALAAIAIIAGCIIGGVGLFNHLEEVHDARVAAADLKKENIDTSAQQALVTELAKEHSDDQVRDAQQTATIQNLVAQMIAQRAQTAKQIATDATLNAQDAGARLASQTHAGTGDITAANTSVTMSLPLTRIVIQDLDQLQQSQSDVTNLTGQLAAQQVITTDAKTELATANQVIAADKTELVATVKADNSACVASTKIAVDAEAAKGRKRGFWIAVASIVFGYAIHK